MRTLSSLIHDEAIRAVLLIVAGWLLSQLGGYFSVRNERKKAISRALSDLLEARHQVTVLLMVVDEVGKLVNIPEHEKSKVLLIFDSILPRWDELHSRYDSSVSLVAEVDPLLAFELRSKDLIRPVFNSLHSVMQQEPDAAKILAPFIRNAIREKVEPVFKRTVMRLARKKSFLCWYETRKVLKVSERLPDEARQLLEALKAAIESQSQGGATAAAQG